MALFVSGLVATWYAVKRMAAPGPHSRTSAQLFTDRFEPIDTGVIRLSDGSRTEVVQTDSFGQSPWVELSPDSGLEITLQEQELEHGILAGMLENWAPSDSDRSSADARSTLISRSQPLAVPVQVRGRADETVNLFPHAGSYPHWRVVTPKGSTLDFSTSIASLLDADAVDQHLAYRGYTRSALGTYARGATMYVPSVELGAGELLLGIKLLGALGSGVAVDVFNFQTQPASLPPGQPLQASLFEVVDDTAFVRISGAVGAGSLVVLVRDPAGGPSRALALVDAPPIFDLPHTETPDADSGGGATPPPARAPSDCECEASRTPGAWTCTPPVPTNTRGAGVNGSGIQSWTTRTSWPSICLGPGERASLQFRRSVAIKVSFHLRGVLEPFTAASGFEYGMKWEASLLEGWKAPPGRHGLGQCARWFWFLRACRQRFELTEGEYVDGLTWVAGARTIHVDGVCLDTLSSQDVCDRTPAR